MRTVPGAPPVGYARVAIAAHAALADAARAAAAWRRVSAEAWAWPARTSTGSSHAIWARRLGADLLDLVVAVRLAQARELAPAGVVLRDPVAREAAALDVRETSFIDLLDALVMTRGPRHVVAVLGGVADAEAHEVEPAAVHEVDDELELVHRLEVGELGLVAGLDERLEAALTRADTPPQRSACSPKRSVSVSSANVVSRTPARVEPRPRA